MKLLPPMFRDTTGTREGSAGRRGARGVFLALLFAAGAHAAALPDQDRDGIPDRDDKCPAEPGRPPDGCPRVDPVPAGGIGTRIEPKIFFRARSAEIEAPARPILDEIAALLRARPDIARITILGHVSRDESTTPQLGQARADAVRTALITRGIAPERLQARAARPVGAGAAPALERRVELRVCDNERCAGGADGPARAKTLVRARA